MHVALVSSLKLNSYFFILQCVLLLDYGVIVVIFAMLLPFLYYEMIFRFNQVPQYLLNISRPFASHWYVSFYCSV